MLNALAASLAGMYDLRTASTSADFRLTPDMIESKGTTQAAQGWKEEQPGKYGVLHESPHLF